MGERCERRMGGMGVRRTGARGGRAPVAAVSGDPQLAYTTGLVRRYRADSYLDDGSGRAQIAYDLSDLFLDGAQATALRRPLLLASHASWPLPRPLFGYTGESGQVRAHDL